MKIEKHLSKNRNHYNGKNGCKYITIHQTGNTRKGANAMNHVKFINNGSLSTWHYTVDSERVVQHYDNSVQCWHCGDGYGNGNINSIGIEMCINTDGDYLKTLYNAIELVQYLCEKHSIPFSNVVQHYKWTKKDCPRQLRAGYKGFTWDDFMSKVKQSNVTSKPSPATKEPSIVQIAKEVINGKYGNGATRKRLLGSKYNDVQKEVNRILLSK